MMGKAYSLHPARIQRLNQKQIADSGSYVLYWMQQSQRADDNHALAFAIGEANRIGLPVVVCFGLMDDYPEANLRHYIFMWQGLRAVRQVLTDKGIAFVVHRGAPPEVALALGGKAALIVCDRGYLRHQKEWREAVARDARCAVVQVESDIIVPVAAASDKREYAARTFRPKVMKRFLEFVEPVPLVSPKITAVGLKLNGIDMEDGQSLDDIPVDPTVAPVSFFAGGTLAAKRILKDFVQNSLKTYAKNRNQPHIDGVSHMSKYLHFGHISPAAVARAVQESRGVGAENRDAYLDELIVRRELACNFVHYTPDYDKYACIPDWARRTLEAHCEDQRAHRYTRKQLESGETHDRYWNAAMREMRETGYMHNYMRMYWGKKILEWSNTPEYAYRTALYLNNKYFIDGRDPVSYANVGWIFGLHDRPWPEREVYGKVRSMSAKGLERKTDPDAYVEKVEKMT